MPHSPRSKLFNESNSSRMRRSALSMRAVSLAIRAGSLNSNCLGQARQRLAFIERIDVPAIDHVPVPALGGALAFIQQRLLQMRQSIVQRRPSARLYPVPASRSASTRCSSASARAAISSASALAELQIQLAISFHPVPRPTCRAVQIFRDLSGVVGIPERQYLSIRQTHHRQTPTFASEYAPPEIPDR